MANITNNQITNLTANEKDSRREIFGTVAPTDVPERILRRRERSKVTQRRRRVAGSLATVVAAAGLVQSNGGPKVVVDNARGLPAHIANVVKGPEAPSENDSDPNYQRSAPDKSGVVTFNFKND